ncbi:MAG: DUF2628 domain-containing protein [Gammaproteobacteria bacterium]|nr:DUF2628 domain-containing protein [Gammaproteobacteria bacterium]
MIEEELYRRATEELNGPNRRADLWKRAVALATDDHDEARYLYTNLRVEELLQERELAGGTQQFSEEDLTESIGEPEVDSTTSIESIDFDAGPSAPASISTPEPELSAPSGDDHELNLGQLSDDLDNAKHSTPSTRPEKGLIGDVTETLRAERNLANAPLGVDDLLSDLEDADLQDDDPTIRISSQDSEQTAVTGVMSESDMELTQNSIAGGSPGVIPDNFDPDAEDFLEETSALPDATQDDRYFEEDNPEIDLDARANQTQDITRHLDDTLDSSLASLDTIGTAAGIGATANTIIGNGRKRYDILTHLDGRMKAIKQGVSWPALFFTMPWLLVKNLWGTLLIYLIMFAVLVVGGIALALHVDAAPAWTNSMRLVSVGFATLAFAGILLIPFVRGNHWVARRWRRKGFESQGIIKANSPEHALNQLVR